MFDQELECARSLVVGCPCLETLPVMDEQLDKVFGILRVIFRT